MPQMGPLWWLFLMFIFGLVYSFVLFSIYFSFSLPVPFMRMSQSSGKVLLTF